MSGRITAKDIMTERLTTLRPETDVYEAIDRLLKNKISGAPVVDEEGKLIGVLSEIDCINRLVQAAHEGAPTGSVEAFMSRDTKTIGPTADLLTIAHLFTHNTFRRLPVVDDDSVLLGQISRRDLLAAFNKVLHGGSNHEPQLLYLSALFGHGDHPIHR